MGCNCHNTIRQDLERIKKLAINTAIANEEDIQIYSWTERGAGRLYDYEPKGFTERGKGVIEIIKFRDHKRKNVLSDSKGTDGNSEQSKKSAKRGKSKRKDSGAKRKVDKSDADVGESKPGDSEEKVAGDN